MDFQITKPSVKISDNGSRKRNAPFYYVKPPTLLGSRPRPFPAGFLLLFVLGLVILGYAPAAVPEIDLSEVEGLVQSDDYQVWIDGQEQFVFKALKQTNHGTNNINTMSFLGFDWKPEITIQVKPKRSVSKFDIRPYSAGIKGDLDKETNTITFTLKKAGHCVLVVNDSYDPVLIFSADPPAPRPDPKSVEYYFGPGIHSPGRIDLKSGEDVYLERGAIVEGCFNLNGSRDNPAQDITIGGRGILALGQWPHQENFRVFSGNDTKNVLIEGITVCDAPGWIVSFWGEGANYDLTVRNVKMVGNFRYNSDGVQTGTEGLLVEDCFLQTNDDTFSLNGHCKDVEIRNNILWNLYNGGVFMLGWATQSYEWTNMNIHDNVIFRAGGCCDYDPKGPFSLKTFTRGTCENILFQNIIIEDIAAYGNWIHFESKQVGTIRNITFENIDVLNTWRTSGSIYGHSEGEPIQDLTFKDVRILGKTIESAEDGGLVLENTGQIIYENTGKVCTLPVGQISKPAASPTSYVTAGSFSGSHSSAATGVNILPDIGFEEGLGRWTANRQGNYQVQIVESPDFNAQRSVYVSEQKGGSGGIQLDVTDLLLEHGPGTYTYSATVRTEEESFPVQITMKLTDAEGTQYHPAPDVMADADNWSTTERTHSLAWTELKEAVLVVQPGYGKTDAFYVGQCKLLR